MWFNRLVNFWQMYGLSGKSGFFFKKNYADGFDTGALLSPFGKQEKLRYVY